MTRFLPVRTPIIYKVTLFKKTSKILVCGYNDLTMSETEKNFLKKWGISFEIKNDGKVSERVLSFIQKGDFTFEAICSYARTQNVMPYIVIGRLQKEKYLDYHQYSNYKLRYKWGDCS